MVELTPSRHLTIRASPHLVQELAVLAKRRSLTPSALARAYLEEGVRMERFPGIVFRNHGTERLAGMAGRRADVWQVVETYRAEEGDVEATADYLQLRPDQVRTAIAYAAAYADEIDALIAENRQAGRRFDEAEAGHRVLLNR